MSDRWVNEKRIVAFALIAQNKTYRALAKSADLPV